MRIRDNSYDYYEERPRLGQRLGRFVALVGVVFAVLAGAQLAGFLGMLIALPVAAVIVVLLRHLRDFYQSSQLYQHQPSLVVHSRQDGSVNIVTEQLDIHVEMNDPELKTQQLDEKSSKMD